MVYDKICLVFISDKEITIFDKNNKPILHYSDYNTFLNELIDELPKSEPLWGYINAAVLNPDYSDDKIFKMFVHTYYAEALLWFDSVKDSWGYDEDTAAIVVDNLLFPDKVLSALLNSPNPKRNAYNISSTDESERNILITIATIHSKLSEGKKIKKCVQCGKYFMTKTRTDEKLCSNACSSKRKACSQINRQNNDIQLTYRRIYNRLNSRIHNKGGYDECLCNQIRDFVDGFKLQNDENSKHKYLKEWDSIVGNKKPRRKGKK